jgi:hypothetical protein
MIEESELQGQQLRARNLRTIAALAGLFLLPLVISFVLYYAGWRPIGSAAHGELLDPPRALPRAVLSRLTGTSGESSVFTDQWALVYVGDGGCDLPCRNALHVMRQTRLLLNQDMGRVRRVFLITAECCDRALLEREHLGIEAFDASGPRAVALLREFPEAARANSLFVVDPLGNLVLSFDTRKPPRGLLSDLKQLLRLSHIG